MASVATPKFLISSYDCPRELLLKLAQSLFRQADEVKCHLTVAGRRLGLSDAFYWGDAREGFKYWSDLDDDYSIYITWLS